MPESRTVRESRESLVLRVRVLSLVAALLLTAVASGFWFVQVVHGSYYRDLADNNRLRKLTLPALRGQIFDREGRLLAGNVPSYDLVVDTERSPDLAESVARAAELLGRPREELEAARSRRGATSRSEGLLLAEKLALSEVARIEARGLELPELSIRVSQLRLYRQAEQTAHLVGYLGEVGPEEIGSAETAYRMGELVGRKGLERIYQTRLRGVDGEEVVVVDSRGRIVEEQSRKPSLPGHDLVTTLDLDLQQEAYRLLGDRAGAVVALDPRDGALRALVSTPSFDPNSIVRRLAAREWQELLEAPNQPLQNRAIQNTFSPGSLFKISVALAGLETGTVRPTDRVWCSGSATFYDHRFRCWKRGGHGWVDMVEALKDSCDVYFYTLGRQLGIRSLSEQARRLGLGSPTGIALEGEKPGLVPDPEWSQSVRGTPWYPGETISVSIGQGPLLATPLQIAVMFAAVANGGKIVTPHLVPGEASPPREIGLHAAALATVRRGLWEVVNDQGTGRAAFLEGVEVAGKTGTVQVVSQATWTKNEELPPELRDHAWFGSFAPFERPELVVVVFVEHGGQGSRAAAPVARSLYERYFELPARPASS